MAILGISGSTAAAPVAAPSLTDRDLQTLVIRHFRELIAPFYAKLQMMRAGDFLRAVSSKPSGIWYANEYAIALRALGKTPVPVRDRMVPASELLEFFREKGCFYKPMGPSQFWENVENAEQETGVSVITLRMKDGVSPAAAYRSFLSRLSFLDCSKTFELALIFALIEIMGTERFDLILNQFRPLTLGECSEVRGAIKIAGIFSEEIPIVNPPSLGETSPEWRVGQTYYLKNAQEYKKRHPHGEAAGMNLIYLGDGLFTGFGLDPEGVTLERVASMFFDEYNKEPIKADLLVPKKILKALEARRVELMIGGKRVRLTLEEVRAITAAPGREDMRGILPQIERILAPRGQLTRAEFNAQDLFVRDAASFSIARLDRVLSLAGAPLGQVPGRCVKMVLEEILPEASST